MRKWFFVLVCCLLFVVVQAQHPGFVALKDEASFQKKFEEESNKISSIKSDFVQEKNMNVLDEKIISKGMFWYSKVSKVRMEYTTPYKYLMIINNENVIIRDEQKTNKFSSKSNKLFEQVNKIMLDCVQGTALKNKDFSIKLFENEKQFIIDMQPVSKTLKEFFSVISIYIDKKDYAVQKFVMNEPTGDNTTITFVNKQLNQKIGDEVFTVK